MGSRAECSDRKVAVLDVAVIGMSGRFPGAENVETFFHQLVAGESAIRRVPESRWDWRAHYADAMETPDKTYASHGAFLDGVDLFDPSFFGISGREAARMDPQQRLFLEESWRAVEDAGYANGEWSGRAVGVFLGTGPGDYMDLLGQTEGLADGYLLTGNTISTYAGRIANFLNLSGPCLTLDTACSSGLVAVHHACESLRHGSAEAAIAGGVDVMVSPKGMVVTGKTGLISRSGACRPFDEGADGYVIGEAVAALVLKPLEDAKRDGDRIYGVIRHTGINHTGRTNGMLAPNGSAQSALHRRVLSEVGVSSESIGYVEAHATGTRLGDAIELGALSDAFRALGDTREQSCPIGSIKANIGHSGHTAGITALIKVLWGIREGVIPPTLNFETPSAMIGLEESPFIVNTEAREWLAGKEEVRRAALNCYGHSGTNVFLVLEEAPSDEGAAKLLAKSSSLGLFVLSARSLDALRERARNLSDWLDQHGDEINLMELAATLGRRSRHFDVRAAIAAHDLESLRRHLAVLVDSETHKDASMVILGKASIGTEATPEQRQMIDSMVELFGASRGQVSAEVTNLLLGFGQAFVSGFELPWSEIFPTPSAVHLPLPGYPFDRDSYWVRGAETGRETETLAQLPAYVPVWREESLVPASISNFSIAGIGVNSALSAALETAGDRVEWLALPSLDHRHSPAAAASVGEVVESAVADWLSMADKPSVFVVVSPSDDGEVNDDAILRGECFLAAVLALAAALARADELATLVVISDRDDNCLWASAAATLLRSASLEVPGLRSLWLSAKESSPSMMARVLRAELQSGSSGEVRYIEGTRHSKQWERLPQQSVSRPCAAIQAEQVYIISGGNGGLGRVLAEDWSTRFGAQVVLWGRSLEGNGELRAHPLGESAAGSIFGQRVDLLDSQSVVRAIAAIEAELGSISGVVHAAGIKEDAWLIKKNWTEAEKVLAPKTRGTIILDTALGDRPLDFFLLFSSASSVFGLPGGCDYAAANRFLDEFAYLRQKQREKGTRHGETISVDWAYWMNGGLKMPETAGVLMEQLLGLKPMDDVVGCNAVSTALAMGGPQIAFLDGDEAQICHLAGSRQELARVKTETNGNEEKASREAVEERLLKVFASALELPAERVDREASFSEFGVDSFLIMELVVALNREFGLTLTPASVLQYSSIATLAPFVAGEIEGLGNDSTRLPTPATVEKEVSPIQVSCPERKEALDELVRAREAGEEAIAIVGYSARLPQSSEEDSFWETLVQGKTAIDEVPVSRWDWRLYSGDPETEPGKTQSKWMGAIPGIEQFDAEFFGISPSEAACMDPQQRLLLEVVWKAIESAGESPDSYRQTSTGLFVGVQSQDYAERSRGCLDPHLALGLPHSMMVNRLSWFFDLAGPSEAVDTACSSGLVALHRALRALRSGECESAIVAGANAILHPRSHLILSQLGMLSRDGQSRPFAADAAGYVRGEGVVAICLKPLSVARAEGLPIKAVLRGSSVQHSGQCPSIGLMGSEPHERTLRAALSDAGLEPSVVSYVEAQGASNPVSDAAEFLAYQKVFEASQPACRLGVLKPNLGHLEAASGLAALVKVCEALQHRILPPALNLERVHPDLRVNSSRLDFVRTLTAWESAGKQPRTACVHSYGLGGTMASVIVEEDSTDRVRGTDVGDEEPELVLFSARDENRLKLMLERFLLWLGSPAAQAVSLRSIGVTLRQGRNHLDCRWARVVGSKTELEQVLSDFIASDEGHSKQSEQHEAEPSSTQLEALTKAGFEWMEGGELERQFSVSDSGVPRASIPGTVFLATSIGLEPSGGAAKFEDQGERSSDRSEASQERLTPAENVEELIDQLCCRVATQLGVPRTAVLDSSNLLELGADSIHFMQFIRWLRQEVDPGLGLSDLTESEDIRGLATCIWSRRYQVADASELEPTLAAQPSSSPAPSLNPEKIAEWLKGVDAMPESELVEVLRVLDEQQGGANGIR